MQRWAIHLLGCSRAPASVLYVRLFFGGSMSKAFLGLTLAAVICTMGVPAATKAADRDLSARGGIARHAGPSCGCCGCLGVTYDYHRELRSTYGAHFDPRNYDQTEPHYYFGSVRAYPRYWTGLGGYEFHY
jgi:hypothetical protein